jgi:hypothetical protein
MKDLSMDVMDHPITDVADGARVYVLMCDDVPVNVYMSQDTAEYEMYLCNTHDEDCVWSIKQTVLCTH